jgi:aldehyde:ferredoxin oxidoreductase
VNKGYIGKILDINLTTKGVAAVNLKEEMVRNFLGGTGLGSKILYDNVGPHVDPLSPDNIVIIAPGPLSGTWAPATGRTEVITKSPLTGTMGRGNFGGWWGPRLKLAGFEGIVFRGEADTPVYLWIDNDKFEIRSGKHLWGKDTWDTTDALRKELGEDFSILAIGQAGENLVRFACPVADYHHAPGRSHAGCVMGGKKLKAIAVRGTREVSIANPERFKGAVKDAIDRIFSYPERGPRMTTGSNYLVMNAAKSQNIPGRNFQSGILPPDSDIWNLPDSLQKHSTRERENACYHCLYAKYYGCDLVADVKEGPYAGLKLGGVGFSFPGWEWGAKCGIKSYPAMWKCRELCNRYGMDQNGPIPFVLELYERGVITKRDTDGLELNWGNELAIHQMIGKIARREGFGDVLADGSVRAAQKIGKGVEKYTVTVKGMEVMSTEPRTATWFQILGNLTCLRGGDDLDTTHCVVGVDRIPGWAIEAGWSEKEYLKWFINWLDMPPRDKEHIFGSPPKIEFFHSDNLEGKAALVKWYGDFTSIFNSLGLCMMPTNYSHALGPTHFAELYSSCTGWDITASEILKTGERIFNLRQAYNVRQGLTRKDDDLPERFYREPWPRGSLKSGVVSRAMINRLLDEYYELRGWDKKKGAPTKRKLIELGLDNVADELSKLGLTED